MENWTLVSVISLFWLLSSCHSNDNTTIPASSEGKWVIYPPLSAISDSPNATLPFSLTEMMQMDSLKAIQMGRAKSR